MGKSSAELFDAASIGDPDPRVVSWVGMYDTRRAVFDAVMSAIEELANRTGAPGFERYAVRPALRAAVQWTMGFSAPAGLPAGRRKDMAAARKASTPHTRKTLL